MELKDRIKEALLSVPEINRGGEVNYMRAAKLITQHGEEVSRVTVGNWIKGITSDVSVNSLTAIQSLTGYSIGWMANGKEPKLLTHNQIATFVSEDSHNYGAELQVGEIKNTPQKRVYVVGTAEGGVDRIWLETGYPAGDGDEYIEYGTVDSSAYALLISGNSMSPSMRPGQALLVEPNHEVQISDSVVVRLTNGSVMVKILASRRNGRVSLDSVNEAHETVIVQEEEIELMHYVTAVVSAGSIKQAIK